MSGSRRTFLQALGGVAAAGVVTESLTGSVAARDWPPDPHRQNTGSPSVSDVVNLDEVSTDSNNVRIGRLATAESVADHQVAFEDIRITTNDEEIREFSVGGCTIPQPVQKNTMTVGKRVSNGEPPTDDPAMNQAAQVITPEVTTDFVQSLPLNFLNPVRTIADLIMDLLAGSDAVQVLIAFCDFVDALAAFLGISDGNGDDGFLVSIPIIGPLLNRLF